MHAAENHSSLHASSPAGQPAGRPWWGVAILGFLALALGTHGFYGAPGADDRPAGFLDALYNAMRLFHMHFDYRAPALPVTLEIARFLAPLVLVVTLFKGFMIVARSHHHALLHRSKHGHVVICGLGQKGLQLARQARARGEWVVVIEKDPRNDLCSTCDEEGIFYLLGDAAEPALLARARAAHAKEIVVVTPEDETNLRIAMQLRQLAVPEFSTRPQCFVHLEDIHLRERLQRLMDAGTERQPGCTLNFFDVYDAEARRVLLELPLDGEGIGQDDARSVHLVILGFGRMGRSLALRGAKVGQFANGAKLRVSVIDRHAGQQRERLLFHHPALQDDAICRLQFHEIEAQSLTTRKLVEGWAAEPNTLLHFFVCLDDNARSLEVALQLQETLANRAGCRLCVRAKTRSSVAKVLASTAAPGPRIVTFGMVEDACCDAAFRHEYNEALAQSLHERFVDKRLAGSIRTPQTDPALRPWAELREDFRESNRQQADHIPIKLRAIGCEAVPAADPRTAITQFKPDELEWLAELEHARWNAERWLAGWRYGAPSNKPRRISEYLVPWKDLDDSIRNYDREAVAEIPACLAAARPALKVVRRK